MTFTGLCHHLHTATICSTDIDTIKRFYVDAMGMQIEGPYPITEGQRITQRKLWDIGADIDFDYYLIHRQAVPSLVKIRFLHLKTVTPHMHNSYSSRELGPFSLGFPNGDIHQMDQRVKEYGFGQMAEMQIGDVTRDGKTYPYYETIYQGPDYLHCVGLQRGGQMDQVSPIDEKTKLGGPGYSAYVTDNSDSELKFYQDILDLEIRFDWVWEASEGSALGIEAGVPFRFVSLYAKGSNQNHLLFLDYKDGVFEPLNAAPRIPNQGLGMWSFLTSDIDKVAALANENKARIVHNPMPFDDPIFGTCQAMSLQTPSGFMIEIINL